jgi:protein-S-isoprenylcysteine O-methyltransferase Ste14
MENNTKSTQDYCLFGLCYIQLSCTGIQHSPIAKMIVMYCIILYCIVKYRREEMIRKVYGPVFEQYISRIRAQYELREFLL